MRKMVRVQNSGIIDGHIQFYIQEQEPAEALEAAGQMIADSDEPAFVYLVDTGTQYIYVRFEEPLWPAMTKALQKEELPLLVWGSQVLPLAAFQEELWMLLENIKDNNNYGEVFRTAVETAFHEALASRG